MSNVTLIITVTDKNTRRVAGRRITHASRIDVDADEEVAMTEYRRLFPPADHYYFHERIADDRNNGVTAPLSSTVNRKVATR